MIIILIFFIAHWYVSLFTQTFFYHRYAAHRMFTMSRGWQKVNFIFSWIAQGSSYLSPYAYGLLHRMHHAYADTELDPHSPKYSSNIFKMMWRTKEVYTNIANGKTSIDERFKKDLPHCTRFEIFADNWIVRISWAAFYVMIYILFATHWWLFLLLPIHFVMGPVHGAIINWFAHKYGYRNYNVEDTSRNIMPLDIFMLGEGYHNNHHKHSGRANFGTRWYEIDPIYPIIILLDKLHVIHLKKAALQRL